MSEKILILAYPGTGKTYIAENYKGVSDIEFQHFRYDYGEYKSLPLEQLKGRTDIRTQNPEWPDNFFKFLKEEIGRQNCVLVPFATSLLPILDDLSLKGVRIIFAIPNKECFGMLEQSYQQRRNSEEFIERRRKDFFKAHDIIQSSKYEKVYLDKDEHLLDGLNKIKIKFNKGKGLKNYI